MGTATTSDAELITASRSGDTMAFGQIVERYQRAVYAVSYSATGNRALSEDVTQDTFVTAWRQLAALRDVERLLAWLCGIARNLARKARHRRGRETVLDDHDVAAADSPFENVSDRQAEQVVAAALAAVPETYREPLVLFYCEHQSVKTVAEALGISEAATHQRLSRGRQYLADGVTGLVERSLARRAPRRDLAAAVVAAIAMIGIGGSQAHASTARPAGLARWKIGVATALIAVIAVTGYVVVRPDADRSGSLVTASSPVSASAGSIPTVPPGARTAPSSPVAQAASRDATRLSAKGAGHASPTLDCSTIAQHFADMMIQTQPDLLEGLQTGTMTADDVAKSVQTPRDDFERECVAAAWPQEFLACVAAADDLYSLRVTCPMPAPTAAPAQRTDDGVQIIPDDPTPRPAYTGTDFGCGSVGKHVATLSSPSPAALAKMSPENRKQTLEAIKRSQSMMADQIEAACDQNAWPEPVRRCSLAATTSGELTLCHSPPATK